MVVDLFNKALETPRVMMSEPLVRANQLFAANVEKMVVFQMNALKSYLDIGLNQMKAFTRCGMGPCQGRMCATTAAEVLAQARGVGIEAIEPYRARFPIKPLTLGELATLAA